MCPMPALESVASASSRGARTDSAAENLHEVARRGRHARPYQDGSVVPAAADWSAQEWNSLGADSRVGRDMDRLAAESNAHWERLESRMTAADSGARSSGSSRRQRRNAAQLN